MSISITASTLYDLVQCPHRVTMDRFTDATQRDPESPFVKLLWERGNAFEHEVIDGLKLPYTDLHIYMGEEKQCRTLEAMSRGDGLIYGGRIGAGDLLGDPDLLRRQGGGYVAGDIKSGAGEEGGSEDTHGKPKEHYAVQLGLYSDILERLGLSGGRTPFIWDVHGGEVLYDLDAPQGVRNPSTLWSLYQSRLREARDIVARSCQTIPALGGVCKLCHWRTACTRCLEEMDDLTLIPELGRARRDAMSIHIRTVKELAKDDMSGYIRGNKTLFTRISPDTLYKFHARAKLQVKPGGKPYLKEPHNLPHREIELFFDIETDPMKDLCYLHGFVERRGGDNGTERYIPFVAEKPTRQEEERAFAEAWSFVKASRPCMIYYYSPYERTFWRNLQKRYPHVASEAEIEEMFVQGNAVDLYNDVVRSKTEWPTRNYSIKTLASYLGFKWRDSDPSGAASIEWFHRWIESGNPGIRQRILDYNEDDCVATRVLLEGIRKLSFAESG